MQRNGDEVEVNTTEARGGETPHIVRYVLIISLGLAVLGLSVVWITGAMNSAENDQKGPVSSQVTPTE